MAEVLIKAITSAMLLMDALKDFIIDKKPL